MLIKSVILFSVFQNSSFGEYFNMLKTRFFHAHNMFVQELGSNGNWLFWGFVIFLVLIVTIYIKSLKDMFWGAAKKIAISDDLVTIKNAIDSGKKHSFENQKKMQQKYKVREQRATYHKELAKIEKDEELSKAILSSAAAVHQQQIEQDELPQEPSNIYTFDDAALYAKNYKLQDMTGLIICLLGRNVSEKKIVQAIYGRVNNDALPDEVIEFVHAIKDFIGYCKTGKFDVLSQDGEYASCAKALYDWAEGNSQECLELLEGLLAKQIADAQNMAKISKDLAYSSASDYACTLGEIASFDNYELALNSFELAIDMTPNSVNAWNLCANMYKKDGNHAKAKEAYLKVLELADGVIYPAQKANANLNLAQYYRSQSNVFKADELEKYAQDFYKEYGLNSELSPQETEVFEIIESTLETSLKKYIEILLQSS